MFSLPVVIVSSQCRVIQCEEKAAGGELSFVSVIINSLSYYYFMIPISSFDIRFWSYLCLCPAH